LEWFSNLEFNLVFSKLYRNFKGVREKRNKGSEHFLWRYPNEDQEGMDCQKGATKVDVILLDL
jgi:hypothetical protein